MLLRDVKTKYEMHRILEYNNQKTKVFCINAEMKHVFENIFIGRPKNFEETEICNVYVYYKEYDIGICVSRKESLNTSVAEAVSAVNQFCMGTSDEFMRNIDKNIMLHQGIEKLYLALVEVIDSKRAKTYKDILKNWETLISIHKKECRAMREKNAITLKKECDKVNKVINILKSGGEFSNDIILTDMNRHEYTTVFRFIADRYHVTVFLKHIDAFLESVKIESDKVVDIRATMYKSFMAKRIEDIILKIKQEDLRATLWKGAIYLKSKAEELYV